VIVENAARPWGQRLIRATAPKSSIKRLVFLAAGLLVALGIAGCGGNSGIDGGSSTEVTVAQSEGKPSGELQISNWPLYIDKKTIPEFEQATGVSVKYVEDINSYDEFFGKMQPILANGESGGRSLMVASDALAKKEYDLGYIQKLDKSALGPALSHLAPVASQGGDPDHTYSIPWQGGMTGLIVNEKLAPDITSVNDLFDPKYKGKVEMVTELREVVPLVMKAEGIDPATATEQDWLDTIDKLKQAGESGQIRRFTGNDYAGDLAAGNAVAVIAWAGDAFQLQADNPDLKWVMPDEGCILWWDNWVIPVGAPNPTAAYAFINYAYQPEHQAQINAWTGSVTPGSGVREILKKTAPEMANSELVFPSEQYTKNCSPTTATPGGPEAEHTIERAWSAATGG
jgi:spermidine/putrescine transport system substrate-binding protein